MPERSVAIRDALRAGDYPAANAAIAAIRAFEELRAQEQNGANVSVVKAALALMGEDAGPTRPPAAWPLAPDSLARLRTLMAGWGLVRDGR